MSFDKYHEWFGKMLIIKHLYGKIIEILRNKYKITAKLPKKTAALTKVYMIDSFK